MRLINTMYLKVLSLFILIIVFLPLNLLSQPSKEEITEGKEYWLALPYVKMKTPEPIRGEFPVAIWISSKVNTKAIVTADQIGFQQSYNITANKITQVPMNDLLMCTNGEIVENNGIHIIGDDPISVCVYQSYKWSGEAFRVIPVDWLGKKYVSMNMYEDETDELKPPQILIVATEDGTNVKYTPTSPTEKVDAGVPRSVNMKTGQTYLILGRPNAALAQDWSTDITGTYIQSNRPIVVISGHTKGAFPRYYMGTRSGWLEPVANFARNTLTEMLWPIEMLGKEYISAPIRYFDRQRGLSGVQDDFGDLIRFVATSDSTVIQQMRLDGSSMKQIGPLLKRGENYMILNQEDPGYYVTNKPVLVGQYGKTWWNGPGMMGPVTSKKDDEIQNPYMSGQGMLIILAPIDRWVTYANFRSPYDIDDFVYITFRVADLPNMSYDGDPIMSKWGGSYKTINGTEYGYITENVSPGDHWIEGVNGAKFAGYAYGNWDKEKDGFAYGYPIGVNYATPCVDSIYVVDKTDCGTVTGTATASPDSADCAALYTIRFNNSMDSTQTRNYKLDVEDFEKGVAKTAKFTLTPLDMRDTAIAVVKFMNISGLSITKKYVYIPEQLIGVPSLVDFKLLKENQTSCLKFKLKNPGGVPVEIKSIRLKDNIPDFQIMTNDFPVTLQPGEEKEVEVCATALKLYDYTVKDSIIAQLTCYEESIALLRFVTGEVIVWMSDQNWGEVPVNTVKKMPVQIVNQGSVPVEIYSLDWPDKTHFLNTEGLDLPLTLDKNGDLKEFYVNYTPLNEAGVAHSTRAVITANTDKIKLYSDWNGIGIDAAPSVVGYDWLRRRVIDNYSVNILGINNYPWHVTISNLGTTAGLTVKRVEIQDDPDGVFKLNNADIPPSLAIKESKDIGITFTPKEQKIYNSKVVFYADFNGTEKIAEDVLKGIGMQPHIDIVGNTYSTPLLVGIFEDGEGYIKSIKKAGLDDATAMELSLINDITIEGADQNAFVIDQSFYNNNPYPIKLAPDQVLTVPIRFTAKHIGEHQAVLVVNKHDAPENPQGVLIGYGRTIGLETTNYNFGLDFVTISNSGSVYLLNTGSTPAVLQNTPILSSVNSDNDYQNFTIKRFYDDAGQTVTFPFTLTQNKHLNVDVDFIRTIDKPYAAKIDYLTDQGNATSLLNGEGKYIRSFISIDKGYTARPGDVINIDVKLTKNAHETKDLATANIKSFSVNVNFKPDNQSTEVIDVYPQVSSPADIMTAGTLTAGWTVTSAKITDNRNLTVTFNTNDLPLKDGGVLFTFKMIGYLSDLTEVPLTPTMDPIHPYVFIDNDPGSIQIKAVCVNDLRLIKLSSTNYALQEVTPNPIKDKGTISYSIGIKANVKLSLYNSFGDKVYTFVDQEQDTGRYEMDFDISQLGLASGVYYYHLESGPFKDVKSMVITK